MNAPHEASGEPPHEPSRGSHPPRGRPSPRKLALLELQVAREISERFLTASTPLEVYRHALARVAPLVGASFASVFLRDDDEPELLRLACAHGWPQTSARYLGELRIREGRGPTGRSVEQKESVAVEDVFATGTTDEWSEPARELGFAAMIALPLRIHLRVLGAVSFYFMERRSFDDETRSLLGVVAHQLAMTAERAQLAAELRSDPRADRQNDRSLRRITEAEVALESIERNREVG